MAPHTFMGTSEHVEVGAESVFCLCSVLTACSVAKPRVSIR
jgi:hypothetical protein